MPMRDATAPRLMTLRARVRAVVERLPGGKPVRERVSRWLLHRRTDVYIVSFPGCGRTWLSMLIAKALAEHHQLPDTGPITLKQLARDYPDKIPRIKIVHDGDPQLKTAAELERDKRRFANKTVILLVRDPRDAAMSYYFEGSKRRGRFSSEPADFMRSPVGSIDTIIEYLNIWAANRHVPRRFCLARYEDLRSDAVKELDRVMTAIGFACDRGVLERAVEFARFDNMRKLEAQGASYRVFERTKAVAAGDTEAFKTRKGKIGGFRDYLAPDEIADIDRRIADRLSPMFAAYVR
jgi:hypothetical protein